MAGPRQTGGVAVTIDPAAWYHLKQECDKYDRDIIIQLRRRIRNAGNIAVERVKHTLSLPSPDGGPDDGAGRAALAAATKVTISFTQRRAGAKVITSSSKLPPEHKGLLLVYNKEEFRHPVFETQRQSAARRGNTLRHRLSAKGRAAWVAQKGRPYFAEPILEVINTGIRDEILAAVEDATNELMRRRAGASG